MIECHLLVLVPVLEHDKVSALLALLSPAATIILVGFNLLGSLLQHAVLADHGALSALALLEQNTRTCTLHYILPHIGK